MKVQDPHRILFAKAKKKAKGLRVFLDMDAVVTFWEKGAAETCGVDYEDPEIREALKKGDKIEDFCGGEPAMWKKIDAEGEEWWENLEKLPWTDRLIEELKKRGDEFAFLTSPSSNPVCAAGKIKWLSKNVEKDFADFLIGRNKHLCAGPNTLLVDDSEKKIKKFREYGGHAFLWPHPLELIDEDVDLEETLKDLFDYIKEIKGD